MPPEDNKPDDNKPQDDKTYDQAYVTRLRNEIGEYRTKHDAVAKERDDLAAYRAEIERKELEAKGEYDKALKAAEKRAADAEKTASERVSVFERRSIVAEAKSVAASMGMIDPSDVSSLDLGDLKIADDGTIPGLAEKITAAKESKPHWFKAAESGQQATPQRRAGPTPTGTQQQQGTDWRNASADDFAARVAQVTRI